MVRSLSVLLQLLTFLPAPASALAELPDVRHYHLETELYPERSRVETRARLTVVNTTAAPIREIPFLLYRLYTVRAVADGAGHALRFTQQVERMQDNERFQVLLVRVQLRSALRPGDSTIVALEYAGPFVGATEVWPYLHDRVSEPYSLLRPDAVAYPILSDTERLRVQPGLTFTYHLTVGVPDGYSVASGGRAVAPIPAGEQRVHYTFRSLTPTWRMDVAAARFDVLRDPAGATSVYHLKPDSTGARAVLAGIERARALCTRWFGPPRNGGAFVAIEIPDGWGSQAGDGYFLQTATAFRDSTRMVELYHELAHSWNAVPVPELQQTRWFDEAFATYFQALARRELEGTDAYEREMETLRRGFAGTAERNRAAYDTPIAAYGAHGLGGASYTKGAWSLRVLHELLGEEAFLATVREFVRRYASGGADFHAFQRIAERHAGRSLASFFEEWIHGGAESSRLLVERVPLAAIVQRY